MKEVQVSATKIPNKNIHSRQNDLCQDQCSILLPVNFIRCRLNGLLLAMSITCSPAIIQSCNTEPASIKFCPDATQKELDDCPGIFSCAHDNNGNRIRQSCFNPTDETLFQKKESNQENREHSDSGPSEKNIFDESAQPDTKSAEEPDENPNIEGIIEKNSELLADNSPKDSENTIPEKISDQIGLIPQCGNGQVKYPGSKSNPYPTQSFIDSNDKEIVTCISKPANVIDCHVEGGEGSRIEGDFRVTIDPIDQKMCDQMTDPNQKLKIMIFIKNGTAFSIRFVIEKALKTIVDIGSLIFKRGSFKDASRADLRVGSNQNNGKEEKVNYREYPSHTFPNHNLGGIEGINCPPDPKNSQGGCVFTTEFRLKTQQ